MVVTAGVVVDAAVGDVESLDVFGKVTFPIPLGVVRQQIRRHDQVRAVIEALSG